MRGHRLSTGRFTVCDDVDGDFTHEEIRAALGPTHRIIAAVPLAGVAEAALAARLWRVTAVHPALPRMAEPILPLTVADQTSVRPCDDELLHRFETSTAWRPPVVARTRDLMPGLAKAWLALAEHWVGVADSSEDLRFLNAACKLLGAVWTRYRSCGWGAADVTSRIVETATLLEDASQRLASRLEQRVLPIGGGVGSGPPRLGRAMGLVTVVLARTGSGSASRFVGLTRAAGLPVHGVCWYKFRGPDSDLGPSSYGSAWYPPDSACDRVAARPGSDPLSSVEQVVASSWEETATALARWKSDLLVLLGMPIVPEEVLAIPRLGVINAHNGSLPGYRGMDAVAWAILGNDPIVCTVHHVTNGVDAGPVFSAAPVPFWPGETLRARVKDTQLQLLATTTRHTAVAGRLPDGTRQDSARARQFYRLHPHLKRVLDESPYGFRGK